MYLYSRKIREAFAIDFSHGSIKPEEADREIEFPWEGLNEGLKGNIRILMSRSNDCFDINLPSGTSDWRFWPGRCNLNPFIDSMKRNNFGRRGLVLRLGKNQQSKGLQWQAGEFNFCSESPRDKSNCVTVVNLVAIATTVWLSSNKHYSWPSNSFLFPSVTKCGEACIFVLVDTVVYVQMWKLIWLPRNEHLEVYQEKRWVGTKGRPKRFHVCCIPSTEFLDLLLHSHWLIQVGVH